MYFSRKQLEKEADYFGIPWTSEISDEQLHALVETRKRGEVMTDPNRPECYGLFWDVPNEEVCRGCGGQQGCFNTFATERLQELLKSNPMAAADASLKLLVDLLEVSPEAILLAKNHLTPVPACPTQEEPEDLADDPSKEEMGSEPEGLEEDMAKKTTKKVVKKAPAKKAATKKKATTKKKPAVASVPATTSEVQDPPRAESVKPATDSAQLKPRAKNAPAVKALAGQSKRGAGRKKKGLVEDPWGRHTWEPRYLRERKHPLIQKLRPGITLVTKYKGEVYKVKILKKYYKYNGIMYPTLYSIVKFIVGTREAPRQLDKKGRRPPGSRQLCNWSAPRFFSLKALARNRSTGNISIA